MLLFLFFFLYMVSQETIGSDVAFTPLIARITILCMYKDMNEPSVLGGVVLIYYKEINSNNPLTISIIYRHLLFIHI